MILRLSLDLPEDEEYVRTTRVLSRALLEDLRVVPGDVDDVGIIVNELCANVVRHARSRRARYQVVLDYHRDKVVVTVRDWGAGFEPAAVPPPGSPRPAGAALRAEEAAGRAEGTPGWGRREGDGGRLGGQVGGQVGGHLGGQAGEQGDGQARVGGFGLPLLRELSDRLEFAPAEETTGPGGARGTMVRAEKALRYRSPAARARAAHMDETEGGEVEVDAPG